MLSLLLGRKPLLAVDVGANIGDYSDELFRSFPGVEVHAFEPASSNVERLKRRFVGAPGLHICHAALSDQPGNMTLWADKDGSGMASLACRELGHYDITFKPMETVTVMRFDDYWGQHLAGRIIDLAKIDVEGYELKVLQGFGSVIKKVRVIQFEFGGTNIDTKVFFRDLWGFFQANDFELYRITPLGVMRIARYEERDEHFIIANFLAVNRALPA